MLFEPKPAIEFARSLHALAEQIAEKNFIVASLHIDYCFFGSWSIEVRKNDEAVRFFFDDRDRTLLVESSPVRGCSAPNEWTRKHEEDFTRADISTGPQRFVINYLIS